MKNILKCHIQRKQQCLYLVHGTHEFGRGPTGLSTKMTTVEPLLRGHHDERSIPLVRPQLHVNLTINILTSTPNERPPL